MGKMNYVNSLMHLSSNALLSFPLSSIHTNAMARLMQQISNHSIIWLDYTMQGVVVNEKKDEVVT